MDLVNEIALFAAALPASCEEMHTRMKEQGFWEKHETLRELFQGSPDLTPLLNNQLRQAVESEKLMLVVGELSEAQEAMRKNAQDDHLPQHMGLAVEVVDAMIRLQDFAGYLQSEYGVDIGQIYADKVAFNASRPHKHGKEF